MPYKNQIVLGRIGKIRGCEGAVAVKLEKAFCENIPEMESVFLEIEGRPVPFFIAWSEYSGGDILKLKFDGYDSIDKMSEFTGCRVSLTAAPEGIILTDNIQDIKGYEVILENNTNIGTITGVIQNPGQWLINILSPDKKEILVPLHEDFILKINHSKKTILMDLPEGLTEIN